MKTKRYWLRGLSIGIELYVLAILVALSTSQPSGSPFDILIIVGSLLIFAPLPIFSVLIGWMWGRIKKDKKFRII